MYRKIRRGSEIKKTHFIFFWNFWPSWANSFASFEHRTHQSSFCRWRWIYFLCLSVLCCVFFAIEIERVDEDSVLCVDELRAQKAILCASGRHLMCFQLSSHTKKEMEYNVKKWSSTKILFYILLQRQQLNSNEERWRRHKTSPISNGNPHPHCFFFLLKTMKVHKHFCRMLNNSFCSFLRLLDFEFPMLTIIMLRSVCFVPKMKIANWGWVAKSGRTSKAEISGRANELKLQTLVDATNECEFNSFRILDECLMIQSAFCVVEANRGMCCVSTWFHFSFGNFPPLF